MTDISREQVVDYLSNLPVIQIADLIKTLEEKWGVKAAPVAVAAAPGAAPGATGCRPAAACPQAGMRQALTRPGFLARQQPGGAGAGKAAQRGRRRRQQRARRVRQHSSSIF